MCDFTCHPQQSKFIDVKKTNTEDGKEFITEIDLYITQQYLNGTYNSCSRVRNQMTKEHMV